MGSHTLIIQLSGDAGFGEKPKVFLDQREVGKVSISNELSLSVSAGQHTLFLKGMAGGGKVAYIQVDESEAIKRCIFHVNIMSLKERYYLKTAYTVAEATAREAAQQVHEPARVTEPAAPQNTPQKDLVPRRKNRRMLILATVALALVVAIGVGLCVHFLSGGLDLHTPSGGPAIAAGNITMGLREDGTVIIAGETSYSVSDWRNIAKVVPGLSCAYGIRSNGIVACKGNSNSSYWSNYGIYCDITAVSDWRDIVDLATGMWHTVGLKSDGTVVSTSISYSGDISDFAAAGATQVSSWKKITAIAAGYYHTVGLRADGTVIATEYTGSIDTYHGQCDVDGWTDIIAISAGPDFTVGLRSDGTVVAVGNNENFQCEVSKWKDIIAISAGTAHTVGLKADGTVVATDYKDQSLYTGQCDVSNWTNIVAVAAGAFHTVGLKADGTVVATNWTFAEYDNGDEVIYNGQCNVYNWQLKNTQS